jgi:hypothetical protein
MEEGRNYAKGILRSINTAMVPYWFDYIIFMDEIYLAVE